ncbi:hypothetical protein ACFY1L_46615 [Streptomyces sp. NPDC001663]|uniref:hypothetical protein n=1 Tax=Streptomyces sp. NPDC001663 TaxID=3364597 RepID=UPI00368D1913
MPVQPCAGFIEGLLGLGAGCAVKGRFRGTGRCRRTDGGRVRLHSAAHLGGKWVKRIAVQLNSIESTLDLINSS